MAPASPHDHPSPWRQIFEEVRRSVGTTRDEHGVLGSINWLRKQMEARGANPNVVRNIIYRDKGKLSDKRVLFDILNSLWTDRGNPPLHAPELEVLLSPSGSAEQEVLQLLGREKRRAFRTFIGGVRSGQMPQLLISGRPGSGKTLLSDYIQQALELTADAADRLVRLEFNSVDLATSLTHLGSSLGVEAELIEARLVRIGTSTAYAVQADAQADVARVILDAVRQRDERLVLLLHVSQSLGGSDSLGLAPLRLNTPEVPRVSASEWLWLSLFEPLSRLPQVALLVSMTDIPARALQQLGNFEGPLKLTPPTTGEARRFVKARLPYLGASQQEEIVQRAGRSFEELRTLTLLAEIREPVEGGDEQGLERPVQQLGQLVTTAGDTRLRDFLAALAVVSLPAFPTFATVPLERLRDADPAGPSTLELAFLDPAPGGDGHYRCFSRTLIRALRSHLRENDPIRFALLNRRAAEHYRTAAETEPGGDAAARHLWHLFEARDWRSLDAWMQQSNVPQPLVRRIWHAAGVDLHDDDELFERIAQRVAAHYVRLGSYGHEDAIAALSVLSDAGDDALRAWTRLKRAEGEVLVGRFDRAESLVSGWEGGGTPLLAIELALVRANIARWRSELGRAAELVEDARPLLASIGNDTAGDRLVRAKVAVWAGLIAKDGGDLDLALREFESVESDDDLIEARVAFQRGDVLMQLGRFDAAERALDRAVELAHRSEALVQEQSRYLARRGTLRRLRARPADAADDFAAAERALNSMEPGLERDFWHTKIADEAALNRLASGDVDGAIFAIRRNIDTFERYAATHDVNAGYRVLRSTLHLAIAYAHRNLPHHALHSTDVRGGADLVHAQRLFEATLAPLSGPEARPHDAALRRRARIAASLYAIDHDRAVDLARLAIDDARFAHQRAGAHSATAAALLRSGRSQEALTAVAEAERQLVSICRAGERGDLALGARLHTLAIAALLQQGDTATAGRRLAGLLERSDYTRFHDRALRTFGERLGDAEWTADTRLRALLQLDDTPLDTDLVRLPDALVSRWRAVRTALEPAVT
jgi:tetratricopeptide (TPR) repeat protein